MEVDTVRQVHGRRLPCVACACRDHREPCTRAEG